MKKKYWVTGLAFSALLVVVFIWFGDKSEVAAIDVVNDIQPVSVSFANIRLATAAMALLPTEELAAYLQRNHPNLHNAVVFYLQDKGKLSRGTAVDSVGFLYGSMENVLTESGDGNLYTGFFENQLVARVFTAEFKEPKTVLVLCLNGAELSIPGEEQRDSHDLIALGTYVPRMTFTIGQREGLVHYVPYQMAIDLADNFGLPLYRGRYFHENNRITPAVARSLEATTDAVQVTVYVKPGDYFDLRNMTYTPVNRRNSRGSG